MAVRMYAARHAVRLESVSTQVVLNSTNPDVTHFEYALELVGRFTDDQRKQLEAIASNCPVRQTLSKRIDFSVHKRTVVAHFDKLHSCRTIKEPTT